MAKTLTIQYDELGDILYINFVPPYESQESDMVSDSVVARTNPKTGRVENLEILSFLRDQKVGELRIPIDAELMPRWDEIEANTTPVTENSRA